MLRPLVDVRGDDQLRSARGGGDASATVRVSTGAGAAAGAVSTGAGSAVVVVDVVVEDQVREVSVALSVTAGAFWSPLSVLSRFR
jgi:hypothetical protein